MESLPIEKQQLLAQLLLSYAVCAADDIPCDGNCVFYAKGQASCGASAEIDAKAYALIADKDVRAMAGLKD